MYGNGGGQAASTAGGNATQPNAPKTNPVEVALQQQALGLGICSSIPVRTDELDVMKSVICSWFGFGCTLTGMNVGVLR